MLPHDERRAATGSPAGTRRPITSRVHGMLDYPAGLLLIAMPWIFGFQDGEEAAVAVPVLVGAAVLLQSVMTDYELSLDSVLPLPAHLAFDVLGGATLAASPWIFGFADAGARTWAPLVAAGVLLVAAGLLTQPERAGGASFTGRVRPGKPHLDEPAPTTPWRGASR